MKEGIQSIVISKSKTFLVFCFCFLVGVAIGSFIKIAALTAMIAVLAGVAGVSMFWKNKTIRFLFVAGCVIGLGILRITITSPDCTSEHQICSYDTQTVTVTGVVDAEPDRRIEKTNYVLAVRELGTAAPVTGRLLLSKSNYPEYMYGDILTLTCRLTRPEYNGEGTFHYDKYLAKDDMYITCSYPKRVEKIGHEQKWFSYILGFKEIITKQMVLLWPEPESSFMAGLLYGARSGLPGELKEAFARTGIAHIVAVSGYNISIIAHIVVQCCIAIGLWRRQAFWATLAILVLFVMITGASASVVRAAIMGILVLVGGHVGRPSKIGITLMVTAASMVFVNPAILIWDIGFQLSFVSTAGLVYGSPVLQAYFPRLSQLPIIGEVFAATLSAQVATLPLILYYFGQLSLSALPANLAVLFLIPWLMLLGFVALILSWMVYPIGQVVAWLALVGLKYIIAVVYLFAGFSWSAVPLAIPWWGMISMYGVIIYVGFYGQRKSESVQLRERL